MYLIAKIQVNLGSNNLCVIKCVNSSIVNVQSIRFCRLFNVPNGKSEELFSHCKYM